MILSLPIKLEVPFSTWKFVKSLCLTLKNNFDIILVLSYLNFQLEEIGNIVDIIVKINSYEIQNMSLLQQFSFFRIQMHSFDLLEKDFNYSVKETKSLSSYSIHNTNIRS